MNRSPIEEDLGRLRKGRGVLADDLISRIGPALRTACGVADGDGRPVVRRKVTARLAECIGLLPDDLQLVALASFAMQPDVVVDRFLTARLQRAGERLARDARTVRRYADDAVRLLAEHLESTPGEGAHEPPGATGDAAPDWRVDLLDSLYRLDTDAVEVYERRRFIAVGSPLTRVDAAISVPRPEGWPTGDLGVRMDLLHGGRVAGHDRIGDRHLRWQIELAEPLPRGGTAEIGLRYVMPAGLWMAPHYVFVPLHPCRRFRLVIRFDPADQPARVYRLDGLPVRALDDDDVFGEVVVPDRFGELALEFGDLRQGLSYGARWQR